MYLNCPAPPPFYINLLICVIDISKKKKSGVKVSGNYICRQWPLTVPVLEKKDGQVFVNYEPARTKTSKCTHSKCTKALKGLDMDFLVGALAERKVWISSGRSLELYCARAQLE